MIATDKPNPFAVLRLPTGATTKDIVKRGKQREDSAADDAERQLVAWAVESLITHPDTRALYELFEMPGTDYDDEWERFARGHRRSPVRLAPLPPDSGIAAFDLLELLDAVIADLQPTADADLAAALAAPAVTPAIGPPPLEVWDVLFG